MMPLRSKLLGSVDHDRSKRSSYSQLAAWSASPPFRLALYS
jgi:hypothetical protein